MPVYEYKCNDCKKDYELLLMPGEENDRLECPECGGSNIKKLITSSINVSNSGANDLSMKTGGGTCCGSNSPCESPKRCCGS